METEESQNCNGPLFQVNIYILLTQDHLILTMAMQPNYNMGKNYTINRVQAVAGALMIKIANVDSYMGQLEGQWHSLREPIVPGANNK